MPPPLPAANPTKRPVAAIGAWPLTMRTAQLAPPLGKRADLAPARVVWLAYVLRPFLRPCRDPGDLAGDPGSRVANGPRW